MEAPNFDGITRVSHLWGGQADELYHGPPRPSSEGSERRDVKKFRLGGTDCVGSDWQVPTQSGSSRPTATTGVGSYDDPHKNP
jgi:hypothetical protein